MQNFFSSKRRGEIATTVTLITLAFMVVGTFLGSRETVKNSVKKYFSSAAESKACLQSCTPSRNECAPGLECRDLRRSPFTATYFCVAPNTQHCSSSDNTCLCAAGSAPAPTTSPGGGSSPLPTGTRFNAVAGRCEVKFTINDDPKIAKLWLSSNSGFSGAEVLKLELASEKSGKRITDHHVRDWPGFVRVLYNAASGNPGLGITKDEILVQVQSDRAASRENFIYTRPIWMDGARTVFVRFEYTPPATTASFSQDSTMNPNCAGPTTPTPLPSFTPSPTPTATPVPLRPACGTMCRTNTDCLGASGVRVPICHFLSAPAGRTATTTGICREATCPDSPTCGCPRATVTPPRVTEISRPSPTLTPPPPTIVSCRADIVFIIDRSRTMWESQGSTVKLDQAKAAIKNLNLPDYVRYQLVAFDHKIENLTNGRYVDKAALNAAVDRIQVGDGTPLSAALQAGANATSGAPSGNPVAILISDGVSSIDKDNCFYSDSITMGGLGSTTNTSVGPKSEGEYVYPNRANRNSTKGQICVSRNYGYAIAEVLRGQKPSKLYTIGVPGTSFNEPLLQAITNIGYSQVTNASIITRAINDAVAASCQAQREPNRAPVQRGIQPTRVQSAPAGNQTITSTFALANNTTSRTIDELNARLCDSAGTCKEYVEKVSVLPGQSVRVPAVFQNLAQNGVYTVMCSVKYTDGTQENCPESQLTAGSVAKVAVNVSEAAPLSTTSKTKAKPCDVNNDGVCNAVDYALAIANYGKTTSDSATLASVDLPGDANFDGKVDATDVSLILSGLGQ